MKEGICWKSLRTGARSYDSGGIYFHLRYKKG